jgi:hypothetical protein
LIRGKLLAQGHKVEVRSRRLLEYANGGSEQHQEQNHTSEERQRSFIHERFPFERI